MRLFFFLCYVFLYSCNDNLDFKNIETISFLSGNTSCVNNINNIKHYDYLRVVNSNDFLSYEIQCEYDDNKIIELTKDYDQGYINNNYITVRKEVSWDEDKIEVIILDYLKGDPNAKIPFLIEHFKITR